jgi:hypothetical protein
MAAGKSTLARDLAQRENAVLLVQDEFLDRPFPGEITDIPGFVKYSSRLKNALGPHVCALLSKGISVVLDFPDFRALPVRSETFDVVLVCDKPLPHLDSAAAIRGALAECFRCVRRGGGCLI